MGQNDQSAYARILVRISFWIVALGAAGTAAAATLRGWRFGVGFLLGAALSGLSFWRWTRVVSALGGEANPRGAWGSIVRFVVLAAAAYAIINVLVVNPLAVFLGLLVSAAAVTISIILELIYN